MDVSILKDEKIEMDKYIFNYNKFIILCSPLVRCKETVELFSESLYFEPTTLYYHELEERNMGVFQGLSRLEALSNYPDYFEGDNFIYSMTPPNGESFVQLCERAKKFIKNILTEKLEFTDVIICSHNHILKTFYFMIKDIPIQDKWYETKFKNGKVYCII